MNQWTRLAHFVAILCLIALGGCSVEAGEEPPTKARYPLLSQLTPKVEELPKNLRAIDLSTVPADELPVKGLKNESITTDPKAFLLGDEPLQEIIDPREVEAMYLGVYGGSEPHEGLGIQGWSFKTEDAARQAEKRLVGHYAKDAERSKFWRVKHEVIWLWHDPGATRDSFQWFAAFVQAKVDGRPVPKFPLPVAGLPQVDPARVLPKPKVGFSAGTLADAEAAVAVLDKFCRAWEQSKHDDAAALVYEPHRKGFAEMIKREQFVFEGIEDLGVKQGRRHLVARAHVKGKSVEKQGSREIQQSKMGIDMVLIDGRWWLYEN